MNQLKKERMQIILVNLATLILFILCLILQGIDNIYCYVIFGIFEVIFIIAFLDNCKGIKNYRDYEENYQKEKNYIKSIKRRWEVFDLLNARHDLLLHIIFSPFLSLC